MTGYFRLLFDIEMPDAWYLECVKDSTGREILPVVFRHGHRFEAVSDVHPYVEVLIAGQPADFRYTVGGVPISSKRFGEIVQRIAPTDIQRIPVAVRLRKSLIQRLVDTRRRIGIVRRWAILRRSRA